MIVDKYFGYFLLQTNRQADQINYLHFTASDKKYYRKKIYAPNSTIVPKQFNCNFCKVGDTRHIL